MPKKKVSIVHFYPLEYFPPVTNLLNYLDTNCSEINTSVHTTKNNKNRKDYNINKIKIFRSPLPKKQDYKLLRIFKYLRFNLISLLYLIKEKPSSIIYYETISSWPVYIYSKYINKSSRIYIHYHEYASPQWYSKYMKLVRYFHSLETKYLYNKAVWISQTNDDRLRLFKEDNKDIDKEKLKVMPNYPPISWKSDTEKIKNQKNRIVYIGSLSFEGSYILEFCEWIKKEKDKIFDIYSYNLHDDVIAYIRNIKTENINLYTEGVQYEEIPILLRKYDTGVILHKAYNNNYKYNATNKLFEYLMCDLNIWFPEELIGCQYYITHGTWPVVKSFNINSLESLNSLKNNKELKYAPKHFFCERIHQKLLESINK